MRFRGLSFRVVSLRRVIQFWKISHVPAYFFTLADPSLHLLPHAGLLGDENGLPLNVVHAAGANENHEDEQEREEEARHAKIGKC